MTEQPTIRDLARRDEAPARPAAGEGVLTLREDQGWWSPKQLAALKAMGIKNASDGDLLVFFHHCQKTGLDPFARQIYLLERRTRVNGEWVYTQTIQVGIDGFRVNAQRVAQRQGIHLAYDNTIWFDSDGGEHKVWLKPEPPAAALVTVVKVLSDGTRLPIPGLAKFESYAAYGQTKEGKRYLQAQWGVMPDHMIEKCAEAFALRRAFPQDLGGMYVEEELMREQAEAEAHKPGRAYRRPPQDGDDGVISGTVEPTAEDKEAARGATAKMNALWRQHGLSGKDHAQTRKAIITGLVYGDAEPERYVDTSTLAPAVLVKLGNDLEAFFARAVKEPEYAVSEVVRQYAERVQTAVAMHDEPEGN